MANLTLEQLQKALKDQDVRSQKTLQKGLDGLARDLKTHTKNEIDELARITNKGFEHIIKQLDVSARVQSLEKFRDIVIEALNIKI